MIEQGIWVPEIGKTTFSECRKYRYTLWREWRTDPMFDGANDGERGLNVNGYLMVIGLNPSTADETLDDPTIRKCVGFARLMGLGALCMTNLFAWRDTDPKKMKRELSPIGEDNDRHLISCASLASVVLAAWGKDGSHLSRGTRVRIDLKNAGINLLCLKKNKDGSPMHPLYVPYSASPIPYP